MPKENKAQSLNPIITLWEKIPGPIRLPIFAAIILAVFVFVKTGEKAAPPPSESRPAVAEEASPAGEVGNFTGVFVEWPEGEIEAYVTHYISDEQVLVALSNITADKKFFIDKIKLTCMDGDGQVVDSGTLDVERELNPGEGTGLFDFKMENKDEKSKDFLNENIRSVDIELEIKEKRKASSSD